MSAKTPVEVVEDIDRLLPAGWRADVAGPDCYVIFSPRRYMVTLDLQDRGLRVGFSSSGRMLDAAAKYTGRGWLARMVTDAIAHLRPIDEGR